MTAASREESLRLGLLGPLVVYRDNAQVELTGPKRRALLTLLALSPGQPVTVDRIIESLWPDRSSGREESTLRVHISHLRDVLESDRDSEPRQLVTSGSAYMLSDADLDVDIDRFEELTRTAHSLLATEPEKALELLDEALRLWRGRPLQDVEYEEFSQEPIRRLEAGRITAVEGRSAALIALDRDAEVVDDLEAMAHVDPNREQPTFLLMQALYRTGRQADALRAARRHRRSLAELGLEASSRIDVLEERILQHDPTLLPEGSHSPADLKIGGSIRGYELREEADTGAVGVVYRAFQASVGRDVAIKVVDPSVAGTPEFVRLFAEEAQTVARLEHPYIVPLYDFWREPAGSFLVMRWMTGDSLERRADSGADLVIESTEGWADDLDFNSDGTLLAGASLTGQVGVWDAGTGNVVAILDGHGDRTAANSSVPDAPTDGTVLFESAAKVNGLGWMPGQDQLASAGFDGTIRLWDPHAGTGEIIHEFPYEAYTVAFSPDGSSLAAVDRSGTVVEVDPDAGVVLRELESTSSAMELAYAPDGSHLLGTGQAGALLWDLCSGNIERTFRGSVYNPKSGIFIDGGSQILVASGEGAIRGYHLQPEDLVDLARSRIGRDLTDDECARYLGGRCN